MAVRRPRLDAVLSDHPAPVTTLVPASVPAPAAAPAAPASPTATSLVVDTEQRTVTVDGNRLTLSHLEFELLAHLVGNPRRVHSRSRLMETVWGRPDTGTSRTVATHIARIRRKLGPRHRQAIATVREIGYTYDPRRAHVG